MGKAAEERKAYRAITDGSFRSGAASASAVLVDAGGDLAQGRLALPKGEDATDAELRALVLALLMAPRGSRVVVETDRTDLPRLWKAGRGGGVHEGLLRAALGLARALDLEVQVKRVPRKRVSEAHRNASSAHQTRKQEEEWAAELVAFLEGLPPRYRMSSLEMLRRLWEAVGRGEDPWRWLAQGNSETRRLLRERLPREGKSLGRLLQAAGEVEGETLEALKGRDREKVWREVPPTPAQLAFLEALGDREPPPASLAEASERIERLLEGRKGRR